MKIATRVRGALLLIMVMIITMSMAMPALASTSSDCASAYSKLTKESKAKVKVEFNGDNANVDVDGTSIDAYKSKAYGDGQGEATTSVSVGGKTVYMTASNIDSLYSALTSLKDTAKKEDDKKTVAGAKDKVNTMIDNFSPEADIDGAAKALSGLKDVVGVVIGLIIYVLMAAVTFFTSCDLAYITIPWFRGMANSKAQSSSGSGMNYNTSKSTGESKVRWITDEAIYAVKTADTSESGRSAIGIYALKRAWAIAGLAIAVYILLTGNVGFIMNLGLKIAGGVIDVISGLGA